MVLDNLSRLARAVESNWCAAWASLGAVHDELPTYVDDTPEFLRVFTPAAPEMLLNIVLRYAGSAPVTGRPSPRAWPKSFSNSCGPARAGLTSSAG